MIENYEQSQKRIRLLERYGEEVRKRKYVQEFIWEDERVYETDAEKESNFKHCRHETMDPVWRKVVINKMKRDGFLVREFEDGFSIEMPQKA